MGWKRALCLVAGGIWALEHGLAAVVAPRPPLTCFLRPATRPSATIHKGEAGPGAQAGWRVVAPGGALGVLDRGDDEYFMHLALDQAKEAFRCGEIPVGAVLVDGQGNVISRARNSVEELGDASAHAELECLRGAARLERRSRWRMTDTTLYVTLEPCLMCLGSIQSFRVRRVVYGAKNHLLGAVESFMRVLEHRHPFHQVEVTGGVLADDCGQIMKDFFAARRRGGLLPPLRSYELGDVQEDHRPTGTVQQGQQQQPGPGSMAGAHLAAGEDEAEREREHAVWQDAVRKVLSILS